MWNAYVSAVGATTLKSEQFAALGDLISMYFQTQLPFEKGKAKKHEFPDAIALLALEGWCKKRECLVLAVSADGGWQSFASKSEHVVVVKDLKTALDLYNRSAHGIAHKAVQMLRAEELPLIHQQIETAIEARLNDLDFEIEAHSHLDVEAAPQSAAIQWLDIGNSPFVIATDDETVTFSVLVKALVSFEAELHYSMHDSVDDDYLSLGSFIEERELEVTFEVVVEIPKNIDPDTDAVDCTVSKGRIAVDFGYVEPQWEQDADEE